MRNRRAILALICCLPALPLAAEESLMSLHASDDSPALQAKLTQLLTGQPLTEIAPLLRGAGARNPGVIDLAAMDGQPGQDLGDGIRSGDKVLAVTFGLRRGWLRADRRIQMDLDHDGSRVTGLRQLRIMAK